MSPHSWSDIPLTPYLRSGRDDAVFVGRYPDARKGFRALVQAIVKERITRKDSTSRNSKNGSPQDRFTTELGQDGGTDLDSGDVS